jgi:amidase
MLPVADGSDLGGSIRNPASFGNLVGLRPTAGRVASARPGNAYDPGSVLGPLARNVSDAATLLGVVSGPERRAPLSIDEDPRQFFALTPRPFAGARIAYSADLGGLPLDPEVRAATEAAARLAADLGAEVVPVDIDLSEADLVFETFRSLEFLDGHGAEAAEHPELVKQTLKDDIAWASGFDVGLIARAAGARTRIFRRFQALFEDFDMLLAPCVQVLPFPVEWEYPTEIDGVAMDKYYAWQRSCSRITASAMPALAMPMTFSSTGLPIGVQFVGPYRADKALLEFGLTWEAAVAGVMRRRPALTTTGI